MVALDDLKRKEMQLFTAHLNAVLQSLIDEGPKKMTNTPITDIIRDDIEMAEEWAYRK